MPRGARAVDLTLLVLCVGCQRPASTEAHRQSPPAPSASRLAALLLPGAAGAFECQGDVCSQPYPRLPDTGEWRCADAGGVVWCAGGEPAAGVVPGPRDASYRCGARFGAEGRERVCLDERPDYPRGERDRYRCSFAQERGHTRVCTAATVTATPALAKGAIPACWLGKDCRSGTCDRGTCRCSADGECAEGTCQLGVCTKAAP